MPCPFPEHHKTSGGSGAWTALLAVLVAIVAAAAITPVVAAVSALIHVLVLIVEISVPAALMAGAGLLYWRYRNHRVSLPAPRRRLPLAAQERPGIEQQHGGVHLHLHGATAEEIAAALRQLPRADGR